LVNADAASGVAGSLIPKILGSLNKTKDPNDSSFQISDIIAAISGGGAQGSGIMDAISKYGGQFVWIKMPTVKLISAMQCHGYK
jgi:hypothetical protein